MTIETHRPDLEDGFLAGIDHTDALLDEALRDTFPASDPIAISAARERPPDAGGTASRTGFAAATKVRGDDVAIDRNNPCESTIYSSESVLVEHLLPAARAKLVMVADNAPLLEAARLLRAGTDLVVVCEPRGAVVGVITKTDIVAWLSECEGAACTTAAAVVMSANVVLCGPLDILQDVWSTLKARGLKNIPIVGADGRSVGVLNARDALGVLLQEAKDEESLLRDYVMGVGYC
jgi:CBS domain-containing protein